MQCVASHAGAVAHGKPRPPHSFVARLCRCSASSAAQHFSPRSYFMLLISNKQEARPIQQGCAPRTAPQSTPGPSGTGCWLTHSSYALEAGVPGIIGLVGLRGHQLPVFPGLPLVHWLALSWGVPGYFVQLQPKGLACASLRPCVWLCLPPLRGVHSA